MKVLYVLGFLLLVAFARAQDCSAQEYECLEPGDECVASEQDCDPNDDICTQCEGGVACVSGKCPEQYVGLDCSIGGDTLGCTGSLSSTPARCENGTCEEVDDLFLVANDACSDDTECKYGLACTSGKCEGLVENDPCLFDGECAWDLRCTGTCTPYDQEGDACLVSTTCDFGLVCSGGECVEKYSVAKGGDCVFTSECAGELVCYLGSCEDVIEGGDSCDFGATPDECNEKTEGSFCFCNTEDGEGICSDTGFPNECADEEEEFESCLTSNKCRREASDSYFVSGGCVYDNCEEEYKEYVSCQGGSCLLGISSASALSNFIAYLF